VEAAAELALAEAELVREQLHARAGVVEPADRGAHRRVERPRELGRGRGHAL